MAEHLYPREDEYRKQAAKLLCRSEHLQAAETALVMLKEFSDLDVRDVQFPKDRKYTCWYVSVKNFPKLPVLNLTLFPKNVQNVEFRYMQFVDPRARDRLVWQTTNWLYARVGPNHFSASEVIDLLRVYVPSVLSAAKAGSLKKGGTSAAETVVADILRTLKLVGLVQGERPEWLRNPSGNPLELDFQIKEECIAIEIQGPHHRIDIFNRPGDLDRRIENDRYKVVICIRQGVSLIWMDSEGVQRSLARLPFVQQQREVKCLLEKAARYRPCFIDWSAPGRMDVQRPQDQS